jgi:iron complex transport system permease protein
MSHRALLAILILIAISSILVALMFGSLPVSLSALLRTLVDSSLGVVDDVVWKLRLPRALAAFACGGLLAVSGVLLQVLLRNPLADPYILGVSGGAALGAIGALLFGGGLAITNLAALGGALAAIAIVFALSFRSGDWNVHRLLLTGVVLSAGFGALISLVLTVAPQAQLKSMLYWLMGDLSHAHESATAWLVLAVVLTLFMLLATGLNALALGAIKARALGVPVGSLQAAIYFCAAAATVAAVMLGGSIAFVGMMVPHAMRLVGVTDHRWLLPASAMVGGSFVTLADTFARTIWAPQQLPVGVFTALIGVPVLLLLLSRKA